jgi:hypothetical protein
MELWWSLYQKKWSTGSASHVDVNFVLMEVYP